MPTLRLLILSLALTCTLSAQASPRAEPGPVLYRFEAVRQGAPVAHTFVLRNTGTAPLRITGVELSPGLHLARMPAQLAPGAQVELAVRVETGGLSGEYEGEVVVRLNDPSRASVTYTMAGRVVPPVEFRPYAAFFVAGQRGAGGRGEIEIVNHERTPLRITRVEHPPDRFTTALETVEEGRRYRLTLALKPDAAAGARQDTILLHREGGPPLRVMANTRVRERVYTFPDVVDLGHLPKAAMERNPEALKSAAQTLMVYQIGGTDFEATFSTDVPGLIISAERGPRGDRWQATVTLEASALQTGPIEGAIVIRTNDADFPTIEVPVSGAIVGP